MATTARKRKAVADEPKAPTRRRAVVVDDSEDRPATSYFASTDKQGLEFISTGCSLMDCALGGGWVLGRISNIVGDRSSGKTLLAIEACANMVNQFPDAYIRYAEAEAAFDVRYAEALGMPVGAVDFADGINTVEDFNNDLIKTLDTHKDRPILYILDSLDALSDEAEAKRDISDGSFGANKAKKMGEMFRRLTRRIESQRCHLMVISQLRDKLNVTFGETKTRSGGRALDFYATHIVWLAELGKMKKTIDKIERPVGVEVKARVKKNKVGLPFRECEYPIIFGYGIDDMMASAQWLVEIGKPELLKEVGMSQNGYKIRINNLRDKGGAEARETRAGLAKIIRQEWERIETGFVPKARKY